MAKSYPYPKEGTIGRIICDMIEADPMAVSVAEITGGGFEIPSQCRHGHDRGQGGQAR